MIPIEEQLDRTRMQLWLAVIFKKGRLAEQLRGKIRALCGKIARREKS